MMAFSGVNASRRTGNDVASVQELDLLEQRFDSAFARGEAETLEQTAQLVLDISSKTTTFDLH
jgi:hypothetical protein